MHRRIRCRACLGMIAVFAVAMLLQTSQADETEKAAKTVDVKVREVTLSVPENWKKEQVTSNLRLAQFRIPAAEGDKEDAELAVFSFGASDVGENVRRWIGQFQPEGRKAKVFTGEAKLGKYVFVDVSGTYNKPVGPPVAGRTEATPGSRVLAVLLVAPEKGVYYLKMAGPDKTVADQAAALRASFGATADQEKEVTEDFE